jgi:DNA-binding LacI/PurR family transcriptional regulator
MDQFNGARDRAQQIGFDIQPFWLGKECKNTAQVCRILRARGIRASLLAPMPDEHHKLALDLDWDKHLVVAIGRSYYGHNVHRIAHNCYDSVMLCYEQLSRRGYQRIAMALCQNDDERVDYQWSSGYLGAQRRYHGDQLEPLMMEDRGDREHFLKWLKRVKPDALIGIWCHDTLTWAREAGIKVPEEMAYASLDLADGLQSGISGIFQNNYEIGAISMDIISSHLYHNSIGLPNVPVVSTIDSKWIDGRTVCHRT